MLGVAIALADDDFSKDEREVTGQLAAAMGCTIDLDQLAAEIRG
jgi:tellurite resistance protein